MANNSFNPLKFIAKAIVYYFTVKSNKVKKYKDRRDEEGWLYDPDSLV